jgi:hypothetical protein
VGVIEAFGGQAGDFPRRVGQAGTGGLGGALEGGLLADVGGSTARAARAAR